MVVLVDCSCLGIHCSRTTAKLRAQNHDTNSASASSSNTCYPVNVRSYASSIALQDSASVYEHSITPAKPLASGNAGGKAYAFHWAEFAWTVAGSFELAEPCSFRNAVGWVERAIGSEPAAAYT